MRKQNLNQIGDGLGGSRWKTNNPCEKARYESKDRRSNRSRLDRSYKNSPIVEVLPKTNQNWFLPIIIIMSYSEKNYMIYSFKIVIDFLLEPRIKFMIFLIQWKPWRLFKVI